MKLLKLSAINFMPYKGTMSLSFPANPNQNVMLVYGDNMRGKTSLLNAIRWAFYGKALGRHSRELPLQDLINREAALEGDWSMETCITFEDSGHTYEYRRRATKHSLVSKPSRPEDFEISRGLLRDGIAINGYMIDVEISRFAPEQTSRFFLFDGELLQEYESLLVDGSEQGRKIKESIEQALGVPALIKGREDAQTLLKSAQKQQTRDLEKITGMERQVNRQKALQAEIETFESDVADLEQQLRATRVEKATLDDFIEATEKTHVAKERLTENQRSLATNSLAQKELENQRLDLMRNVWKDLIRPQIALKREHLMGVNNEFAEIMIRKANIAGQIEQVKKSLANAICHACGQALHQAQRELASAELGRLEAEYIDIAVDDSVRTNISAEIRDLDRLLKPGPAAEIKSCDKAISKLKVEQTKLDNEIEKLHDQIKGQDTAEIVRKRVLRDGLIKIEGGTEQNIRLSKAKLEKNNKELQMIAKALESIPTAREAKSTQIMTIAGELERVYGRSIDRLRDDLKIRVEKFASDAFKALTTQSKYSGLRINNNYGLAILDERGHEVTIRSAGAEQIVALSLIDGLARASRSSGPIVMDTPFGRLDPGHRANILKYLPKTTDQLILFVHEGEVARKHDLADISSRIDSIYEIKEISSRHSKIEKVSS
jgi:DNA sulfur modification protein DndD